MPFSSWKIWLHPRSARMVMDDLENQVTDAARMQEAYDSQNGELSRIRSELAETAELADRQKLRISQLEGSLEKCQSLLPEIEKEKRMRKSLEKEISGLREELARRREAEEQIKEFEGRLGSFEDLKRQYETRIKKLRAEIESLRRLRTACSPQASDLEEIDMSGPVPVTRPATPGASGRQSEESADWLELM